MPLNRSSSFPSRRQRWLPTSLVALGMLATLAGLAQAQDYPNKPIRIIVPTPAGSGPDVDIRQVGQRLSQLLGQSVVIENRPGAGGRIATEVVTKAPPDGYTLLLGTPGSVVIGPLLYPNLPYDAKTDLAPVSLISTTAYALVTHVGVPASDARAYVAMTHGRPEFANVGTLGVGSTQHLTSEWFNQVTQAHVKPVHYNTSNPYGDMIGGQMSGMFEALLPLWGSVRQGKLKVLAITGKQRWPQLPEVPTFAESGYPAFDPLVWVGLLAPTGTPAASISKVSEALGQIARQTDIVAQRREAFSESVGSTPQAFAAFLDAERSKWGEVIRRANIRLE